MSQATNIWNLVNDTWAGTLLIWNLIPLAYLDPGKAPDDYLDWDAAPDKKAVKEEFIKIFITVHNQFLTEEQKKLFRLAKLTPTYSEKFQIKKEEKIILKEYKVKHNMDLEAALKAVDVKLGLQKIEEYVRNRTKK
jgi:hypothetical protein